LLGSGTAFPEVASTGIFAVSTAGKPPLKIPLPMRSWLVRWKPITALSHRLQLKPEDRKLRKFISNVNNIINYWCRRGYTEYIALDRPRSRLTDRQLLLLLSAVAHAFAVAYQIIQILLLSVESGVERALVGFLPLQVGTAIFALKLHLR